MKYVIFAIALLVSAHVNADESTRHTKINEIIEAQGLQTMFQQQLDQAKESASASGKSLFQKALAECEITGGEKRHNLEQIFIRYLERSSAIFSAKELVDTWSRFYGSSLSEADLDKILAYYKSSSGKKDVAATQNAMLAFSQVISIEMQRRTNESLEQFMAELKAAMTKTNMDASR